RGSAAHVQATAVVRACGSVAKSVMCQLPDASVELPFGITSVIRNCAMATAEHGTTMPTLRRTTRDDPYADETIRQVGERATLGLVFFVVCVILSSGFEIARFPERRAWMLGFAAGFMILSALCSFLLRRWPGRTVEILIVFVNVIGMALNAYHAIVGASV